MSLVAQFIRLLENKGSPAVFHRESASPYIYPATNQYPETTLYAGGFCPCRTPEGYRDPKYHLQYPDEPVCNEQGILPTGATEFSVKAFIQPIQSTRATRLSTERMIELVGEIQANDHLGILPCSWQGNTVDFTDWSDSGDDYILYNGDRYTVINVNVIPDPSDGNPNHHVEIGLRQLGERREALA